MHLAGSLGSSLTTRQIAAATRVPPPYLSKVMQGLARAGIARPFRGVRGGFSLARDPAEISVFEVVNAVDPIRRIEGCPLGLLAHGRNLCPLHRRLDRAIAMVEAAFKATSLADLLEESGPNLPLCPVPYTENAISA